VCLPIYDNPRNKFVAGFIGSPPMNFFDGEITEEGGKLYFVGKIGKYQLPEDVIKKLKENISGKKVILGVRPEELTIGKGGFVASVEFYELLGSETIIYLKIEEALITAKVLSTLHLEPGENIKFDFTGKIHLFDTETEESLLTS
jgi:multiple sugar transport system ATP-binding protein